jgi:hypothetical protein
MLRVETTMSDEDPNPDLIALGIRQPWAELILRGVKTIEVRSQDTNVRGPIYLYVSKKLSDHPAAAAAMERHKLDVDLLPLGVLVGTVEIHDARRTCPEDADGACLPPESLVGYYGWHLRKPVRLASPVAARFLPYGVWFYPFKRRQSRNLGNRV